MESLKGLQWVFALALLLFILFGVSGMMLFGGHSMGRCHYLDPEGMMLNGEVESPGGSYLGEGEGSLSAKMTAILADTFISCRAAAAFNFSAQPL